MSNHIEGDVVKLSKPMPEQVVFITLLNYTHPDVIPQEWCASGVLRYSQEDAEKNAPTYNAIQFCIVRVVIPVEYGDEQCR